MAKSSSTLAKFVERELRDFHGLSEYPLDPDFEPKSLDPFEDEAEVVSDGGQDRIDGIALFMGEVVAVHPVAGFKVAYDWLDG